MGDLLEGGGIASYTILAGAEEAMVRKTIMGGLVILANPVILPAQPPLIITDCISALFSMT